MRSWCVSLPCCRCCWSMCSGIQRSDWLKATGQRDNLPVARWQGRQERRTFTTIYTTRNSNAACQCFGNQALLVLEGLNVETSRSRFTSWIPSSRSCPCKLNDMPYPFIDIATASCSPSRNTELSCSSARRDAVKPHRLDHTRGCRVTERVNGLATGPTTNCSCHRSMMSALRQVC